MAAPLSAAWRMSSRSCSICCRTREAILFLDALVLLFRLLPMRCPLTVLVFLSLLFAGDAVDVRLVGVAGCGRDGAATVAFVRGGFGDFHYCGHRRVGPCQSLVDAWCRAQIPGACRTVGCGHAAAHPRWRRGDHPLWLRTVHPRFSRVDHPLIIVGEDGVQFFQDCDVFLL